jgi:hypothetical protein
MLELLENPHLFNYKYYAFRQFSAVKASTKINPPNQLPINTKLKSRRKSTKLALPCNIPNVKKVTSAILCELPIITNPITQKIIKIILAIGELVRVCVQIAKQTKMLQMIPRKNNCNRSKLFLAITILSSDAILLFKIPE